MGRWYLVNICPNHLTRSSFDCRSMELSMKSNTEHKRHELQDWGIVLLLLLIGFCCVIFAGQWALRFAPSWQADTNLESNIDLNSEYLTNQPVGFFEPVDPAILTQPGWANGNIFLTPGADFVTGTPLPPSNPDTAVPTITGTIPVATNTLAATNTTIPTNTLVYFPPAASKTPKPKKTKDPTATATTPASVDLQITQVDGTTTYSAGSILTYTVTVTNAGPGSVTGAVVTDNIPAQILNWQWTCTAQNGGATGCDVLNGNLNFSDTVNLPSGASIVYTMTANISPVASGDLVNTASVNAAGYTDSNPRDNTSTDTNTPVVSADLWITKDDGATTYVAGGATTYTVTVGNNGPDNITGALVTDNIPAQVTNWTWTCTAQNGGATGCDGMNSNANFTDTVNLPSGASIVYTVTANISPTASGDLVNTASVSAAGYIEAAPGNESQTDTDTP